MKKRTLLLVLALGLLLQSTWARSADAVCAEDISACREVGAWEFSLVVGLGGRTNPLVGGDDQPIVLVPQFSWYGKKFFLDNFDFGFTFIDKPKHMLNLLVTPGFDHTYFEDFGFGNLSLDGGFGGGSSNGASASPAISVDDMTGSDGLEGEDATDDRFAELGDITLDDIAKRKIAFLSGLEYGFFHEQWQAQVQILSDVSGVHTGSEFRLSGAYNIQKNTNLFTVAAGVAWQSEELLTYYYGLDERDVDDSRLHFNAEAGVASFLKVSWQKKLNKRWSLLATANYRLLDSALEASPLIDARGVASVFVGGSYHF